jgi:preprotein translocase subunit SecD
VLVVLMMLVVYHLSGVNAIAALALNVLIIFGGLAYFGATLTCPASPAWCSPWAWRWTPTC